MFKKYLATESDLKTIQEALSIVWDPRLDVIFRRRKLMVSTIVVSFDSRWIYLWIPTHDMPPRYGLQKIAHFLSFPRQYQRAWYAGLWEKVEELLPNAIKRSSRFVTPRIGGGLLGPFLSLQKSKGLPSNPYTTKESYLATIVHEFGHVYWNQHRLWWYSNKMDNLRFLRLAHDLSTDKSKNKIPTKTIPYFPSPPEIGELFAFCCEYAVSETFWPDHKTALDSLISTRTTRLIELERQKDLLAQDSVLEPTRNPHDFALIVGKIVLTLYPSQWSQKLTSFSPLIHS